jgi:hypothetical protein
MSLAPGKGAHLVLNEAVMTWLSAALSDVRSVYTDELHDETPEKVITGLLAEGGRSLPWASEKDTFGNKAYTSMVYKEGELRVTAVHNKRGLSLDIREWFQPS